jgi:hypothetical protein
MSWDTQRVFSTIAFVLLFIAPIVVFIIGAFIP